jgi:hypothetical protein
MTDVPLAAKVYVRTAAFSSHGGERDSPWFPFTSRFRIFALKTVVFDGTAAPIGLDIVSWLKPLIAPAVPAVFTVVPALAPELKRE